MAEAERMVVYYDPEKREQLRLALLRARRDFDTTLWFFTDTGYDPQEGDADA
jgi:hypothetical protein